MRKGTRTRAWVVLGLALVVVAGCRSHERVSLDDQVRSWPEVEAGGIFAESARTWKVEQRRVSAGRVTAPGYVLFPGQKLEAKVTMASGARLTFWTAGLGAAGTELEVRFEGEHGQSETRTIAVKPGEWSTVRLWGPAAAGRVGVTIRLAGMAGDGDANTHDRAVVVASPRITSGVSDSRPNIILISIDTLRADHLGSYGYSRDTSPEIDRFARDAVRFTNCYSHASWTPPSVASLFTSLYPPQHGSLGKDRVALDDANETLAEALADEGYRTMAFSASPFIHPDFGFGQGFMMFGFDGTERAENLNALALPFLEPDESEPMFVYIMYFDPHFPYEPPAEFADRFRNGPDGKPLWDPAHVTRVTSLFDLGAAFDRETFEYLKSEYDSEIASTDQQFGILLHALETWGLHENAWIILTADHGEEFLDHGDYGHGNTLYREVLRVPLIVRPPAFSGKSRVVRETVRQVDVMPTLLEAVHVKTPDKMMGESLMPIITGNMTQVKERPVFAYIRHLFHEGQTMRSYQTGGIKLIVSENPDRAELFNLDTDPSEQNNLAPAQQALLQDMTAKLLDYERAVKPLASIPGLVPQPDRTRQILESLGYIGR